jgi:hydroxymethylpyrimidine pyrophosphatase-like HAD family hydrolase
MLERHKIHGYFTKIYIVINFARTLSLPLFDEFATKYSQFDLNALNQDYGIFLVNDPDLSRTEGKTQGVKRLLNEFEIERLIMIGDSISDYLEINDSRVENWAVGNASPEYKAKCKHIATKNLAEGVQELLEQLILK